ncbi:MAG TPA: hypothetical protein VMW50_00245 [Dehalococcoidia bacterium]|nr:hypothetical protein [Dehalococcoidia bacterium]
MASNGSDRGGLLTAGGILSIIGGALEVIGGVIIVLIVKTTVIPPLPLGGRFDIIPVIPTWLFIAALPLIVLGIIAIVGGISAIRRKSFGLSLAGAICALPSNILGILAIIFVSLSKREFRAEN